jgi:hypothetical protein
MHLRQEMYVSGNGKEIGVWRWQRCGYDNSAGKARARGQCCQTSTGKARAMQQWRCHRGDEGEVKQLGKGTC